LKKRTIEVLMFFLCLIAPGCGWGPSSAAEEVASISNRTPCEKYRGPISAYLEHVTPKRANLDRSWNVFEMHEEIRPLIRRF
jgi:hypothetical protein